MKLKNTTDWPDYFLRRMVAWCRSELEMPAKWLHHAQFRKRTTESHSGCGGSGRIVVSIGPASKYPTREYHARGYPGMAPAYADPVEALVAITAHELTHVREMAQQRRYTTSERQTMYEMRRLHAMFVASKDALLAEWSVAPAARPARPRPSVQAQRAAKAQADLERWQRKAKLAQTKIKKLKARVRYYDRVAATGSRVD